jgi:membrane-associated phospholipid phosphatase
LTCLAAFGMLAVLSVLASTTGVLPLDGPVRRAVLKLASPEARTVAWWVNHGGSWEFLLPAMLVLFVVSREARRHWWLWAAILPLAAAAETFLKTVVGRTRPMGPAMGFPSGHVTAVAAFALLLIYLTARMRLAAPARRLLAGAAILLVLLVGLARVLLGAHWPSDVLGGLLLGVTFAAAGAWWHSSRRADPSGGRGRAGGFRSAEGAGAS